MKKQNQITFTGFIDSKIEDQQLQKIKGGDGDDETNIIIEEDIIG